MAHLSEEKKETHAVNKDRDVQESTEAEEVGVSSEEGGKEKRRSEKGRKNG